MHHVHQRTCADPLYSKAHGIPPFCQGLGPSGPGVTRRASETRLDVETQITVYIPPGHSVRPGTTRPHSPKRGGLSAPQEIVKEWLYDS